MKLTLQDIQFLGWEVLDPQWNGFSVNTQTSQITNIGHAFIKNGVRLTYFPNSGQVDMFKMGEDFKPDNIFTGIIETKEDFTKLMKDKNL